MRVEIDIDDAGGPVFVKRADTEADAERLRVEATRLAAARHPGVAELLSFVDGAAPTGSALTLRWVGPHSLATTSIAQTQPTAALIATLAETVADLHGRGMVHNRIRAEHVVLGSDGAPVLCGLAEAASVSHSSTADDVLALGALLAELLAGGADGQPELEPIPDRRGPRQRPRWTGYQRRSLLLLADQAQQDDASARPAARDFAHALRTTVPGPDVTRERRSIDQAVGPGVTSRRGRPGRRAAAHPALLPPTSTTQRGATESRPPSVRPSNRSTTEAPSAAMRFRAATTAGSDGPGRPPHSLSPVHRGRLRVALPSVMATLALLAVAISVVLVLAPTRGHERGAAAAAAGNDAMQVRRAPTARRVTAPVTRTTTVTRSDVPVGETTTTSRPLAACHGVPTPADATRCPAAAASGGEVELDGVAYQLGRPGDLVTFGDWACDGHPTPALLRVTTGEVFIFRAWATAAHPLTVPPVTTVIGAVAMQATASPGRPCPLLEVERAAGPPVTVTVGR